MLYKRHPILKVILPYNLPFFETTIRSYIDSIRVLIIRCNIFNDYIDGVFHAFTGLGNNNLDIKGSARFNLLKGMSYLDGTYDVKNTGPQIPSEWISATFKDGEPVGDYVSAYFSGPDGGFMIGDSEGNAILYNVEGDDQLKDLYENYVNYHIEPIQLPVRAEFKVRMNKYGGKTITRYDMTNHGMEKTSSEDIIPYPNYGKGYKFIIRYHNHHIDEILFVNKYNEPFIEEMQDLSPYVSLTVNKDKYSDLLRELGYTREYD